jgi:hypothetical protein
MVAMFRSDRRERKEPPMKVTSLVVGTAAALVMSGLVIVPAYAIPEDPAYCGSGPVIQKVPTYRRGGSASCSSKAAGTKVRVRVLCEHDTPTGSVDTYWATGPYVNQDNKTSSVAYCEVNDWATEEYAQVK